MAAGAHCRNYAPTVQQVDDVVLKEPQIAEVLHGALGGKYHQLPSVKKERKKERKKEIKKERN